MSSRSSLKKMSQSKERQKQGLESEAAQYPFPLIASYPNSLRQAASNDVSKASRLLETMASSVNFEEHVMASAVNSEDQDESIVPRSATLADVPSDKANTGICSENPMDLAPCGSTLTGHHKDYDKDHEGGNAFLVQGFSGYGNLRFNTGLLNSVPVEPEWGKRMMFI